MVKTASLFSQLLVHFPRLKFSQLVAEHGAERHAKGFRCWTQFVAMLFCHLGRADSLREICLGLAQTLGKLRHLDIDRAPNKSTLSYANAHRPAELFKDLFYQTLDHFSSRRLLGERQKKFRFKNRLLSLDSTTIPLCLSLFPWAEFRRAKGGVKVHVLLDHTDYMPAFVLVTEARRHDRSAARGVALPAGSIVAMDMAYTDYRQFARWTDEGVWFVTRQKDNAVYKVEKKNPVPQRGNILSDQLIRLTGQSAAEKCPHLLRRVVVWDADNEREIVLLTNHLDFGPTTIAAIYKDRWQIELFFKALKQNLRIKTFVGTSENALLIQIWTALIALLLLKWLHFMSQAGWSLSNTAAMLRLNLFTYRDLIEWLRNPLQQPPLTPGHLQLVIPLPGLGQPEVLNRGTLSTAS